MISLTNLYDEYIERQKLTEQNQPFEYIVPPPLLWVGTLIEIDRTFRFFNFVKLLNKNTVCTAKTSKLSRKPHNAWKISELAKLQLQIRT